MSKWYKRGKEHLRRAHFARDQIMEAIEIEAGHNYNGSGKNAFGGADKWPVANINIPFPEGHEKQRDEFIEKLKTFIDKELPLYEKENKSNV